MFPGEREPREKWIKRTSTKFVKANIGNSYTSSATKLTQNLFNRMLKRIGAKLS